MLKTEHANLFKYIFVVSFLSYPFLSNGMNMLSVCARSSRTYTCTITCGRAVTNKSYLPYSKMALFGDDNKVSLYTRPCRIYTRPSLCAQIQYTNRTT